MKQQDIQDETYNNINFSTAEKMAKEYDNCLFTHCDFSNADLSDVVFIACQFTHCNLSSTKINNTSFQNVGFKSSKMLGLQFDECSAFALSFNFEDCVLNHCSFYKLNISNTEFTKCQMKEVDFTHTNLTESTFDECDLYRATFDKTNIGKTNFQTAINFSINPTRNTIKKALFSTENIHGLLDCFDVVIDS